MQGQLKSPTTGRAGSGRLAAMATALLCLGLTAGGCSTSVADLPLVGVPADAPARPKERAAFPAVHDMPAARQETTMDAAERARIQAELVAARDRQAATAAADAAAAAASAAKANTAAR